MSKITNDLLEDSIEKVNEKMEYLLKTESSTMSEIMTWILSSRGKQIRPRMVIAASRFGTGNVDVTEFAAIIEIIHMASLVHDDIIDDADTRRGQISVQKKFGKDMAVYAGDFMIFSAFLNSQFKPSLKHRKIFSRLNNMCCGEVGQHDNLYNKDITIEQYLSNITGKTADLFRIACVLGATEGNCRERIIDILSDFGYYFGMIFQIRDDLLDFLSTDEKEGKPMHHDILCGVYTLPLIYTFMDLDIGDKAKKLVDEYQEKKDRETGIELNKLIEQSGGIKKSFAMLNDFKIKAQECLDNLPDIPEKEILREYLEYVSEVK